MDAKMVELICQQIYREFPEVAGIEPKVRKQPIPTEQRGQVPVRYLLTFHFEGRGPTGQSIPRWVRVVTTPQGKITKTTTSR